MVKFVKVAAAAALLASTALAATAQTQNPNADPRPLPQDGMNQQPYDNKTPTNPPPGPAANPNGGTGSRALTPGGNPTELKTEPSDKGTTNMKKLDNQGRGGQPQ